MGCCFSIYRKIKGERPSAKAIRISSNQPTTFQESRKLKKEGLIGKMIDMISELTSKDEQKTISDKMMSEKGTGNEENLFWNELVKRQRMEMEEKAKKIKDEERRIKEATQELKRIEDEMKQLEEEQEKWVADNLKSKRERTLLHGSLENMQKHLKKFDKSSSNFVSYWKRKYSMQKKTFFDEAPGLATSSHDVMRHSSHRMELVRKPPQTGSQVIKTSCDTEDGSRYYIGKYQVISVVGKGCCGKVLLATDDNTGILYALKIVKKHFRFCSLIDAEKTVTEILGPSWHPFIVKIFSCHQTIGHFVFVMEYLEGRNMNISLSLEKHFSEPRTVFYASCILLAIGYLHSFDISHRDIKLENIVLDRSGYPKLIDFGMSVIDVRHNTPILDKSGTKLYQGPEFLIPGMITRRSSDFWGLGVIIHAMLTGKFIAVLPVLVMDVKNLSRISFDLLKKMFQTNPLERLGAGPNGAKDIMKHAFFKHTRWDDLLLKKIPAPVFQTRPVDMICLENAWESIQKTSRNAGSSIWEDVDWVEVKKINENTNNFDVQNA